MKHSEIEFKERIKRLVAALKPRYEVTATRGSQVVPNAPKPPKSPAGIVAALSSSTEGKPAPVPSGQFWMPRISI